MIKKNAIAVAVAFFFAMKLFEITLLFMLRKIEGLGMEGSFFDAFQLALVN